MWNAVGAIVCAFVAGVCLGTSNLFGFWLNVFFALVNLAWVWHDLKKAKGVTQ